MPNGRRLAPMYSSNDILISTMLFDFPPVPPEHYYAQIRIHVTARSYPIEQFLTLADDFHSTFQREFGEQIQDWEEPHDDERDFKH